MVETVANYKEVEAIIRNLFKPVQFIGCAELHVGSYVDFENYIVLLAQVQSLVDIKIQFLLEKREVFPLHLPYYLQNLKATVKAGLSLYSIVDVRSQEDKVLECSQRKYLHAYHRFFTHLSEYLEVYQPSEGEQPPIKGFYQYTSTLTEEDILEMQADMLADVKIGEKVKLFHSFFRGYKRFRNLHLKKKVRLLLRFIPIHPKNMELFIRSCSPDFNGDPRYNCMDFEDKVDLYIEELEKD